MSKQQVIDILGRPDGFRSSEHYEALTYTNKFISGWSWDRENYVVILKDGSVVEYGAGEVRQNTPNTGVADILASREDISSQTTSPYVAKTTSRAPGNGQRSASSPRPTPHALPCPGAASPLVNLSG
jgi:hypothetical protein